VISSIGTYLPVWRSPDGRRVEGEDEDAITLAIAAGRLALAGCEDVLSRVQVISRQLPLLEGGNAAALLAGLGLPADTEVLEQVGGAASTMDALLSAAPGTLVIGADTGPGAGASAAVIGAQGLGLVLAFRVNRSLPVTARDAVGNNYDYGDPRLLRERGAAASLSLAHGAKPDAIAGLGAKEARALCAGDPPELPTTGASATLFCLAALAHVAGTQIAGVDQATVTSATLGIGAARVTRDERPAREKPHTTYTPGPPIPIALPAYDRAFDAKLRWHASTNRDSGRLDFPPRLHDALRRADGSVEVSALPRTGSIYTTTTIHVPVPGKATPYQLVIVELDDGGVRSLVPTTAADSAVEIGDRGEVVFRRVATRSGIPDYGYAFRPVAEATA
jgi:uncharacterized OB-fold protein